MSTFRATGINGEPVRISFDPSMGVTFEGIPADLEWDLTVIDDLGNITVTRFVGGRPKDRK